jgi:hypothetical protein
VGVDGLRCSSRHSAIMKLDYQPPEPLLQLASV